MSNFHSNYETYFLEKAEREPDRALTAARQVEDYIVHSNPLDCILPNVKFAGSRRDIL